MCRELETVTSEMAIVPVREFSSPSLTLLPEVSIQVLEEPLPELPPSAEVELPDELQPVTSRPVARTAAVPAVRRARVLNKDILCLC
jgi:hypothetical protein